MRRFALALLGRIRRIPRGTGVSVLGHSLLLTGLFLLPGPAGPPPPGEQSTLVRVDPDAPSRLVEPEPPPPPADPPPDVAEPVPLEPRVVDAPPPEPEVFADASFATAAPAAPADFAPSVNRVIGIGPGDSRAPSNTAAPAAPAPPVARPEPPAPPPTPVRVLAQPLPEYPRRAEELRLEGVVTLLVEVLPDGRVGRIDVKESTGHGILDRAAIEGVRKWEFRPATLRGQPVRSFVEVPVRFTP